MHTAFLVLVALVLAQPLAAQNAQVYTLHLNQAGAAMERGDMDTAVREFELALSNCEVPICGMAHNSLSAALAVVGRREEALEHAREAVALIPGDIDVLVRRGRDRASLNASFAQVYVVHFQAAARQGYWAEAYESYLHVKRHNASLLGADDEQNFLERKRETDEARESGEAIVMLAASPREEALGYTVIGEGYRLFGRFAEAVEAYGQALGKEPGYEGATEGLRLARLEDGLTVNAHLHE